MSKRQGKKDRKDSFVFYCDWIDHLSLLDPAEAVAVLRSVRKYITEGQSDVLHGAAAMAFSFIRSQIDRDQAKWEEVRAKRAEAGKAGAEATNTKRQESAKAAKVDFAEQDAANPAVPVPVPAPVSVPEPVNDSGCNADKPHKRPRFTPPTLEQVAEYVKQRGSHVDPQGFIDYYDARGWMMGKTPMKDWKAACRNAESWERWGRKENGGKKDAGTAKPFAESNTGTSADEKWNLKSAFDE